jgi:hypothetical protein
LYLKIIFGRKSLPTNEEEMNRLYILIVLCCCVLAISAPSFAREIEQISVQSEQVAYGVSLYEEFCANCHKSFAKTTKPQRSVNRLRSSIEYFPVMNDLDFLSDQQLDAIATALRTIPLKEASLRK